ncbi:MAG: hypothetical protein ACREIF_12940 [Chthoniobacterales bacterium]
MKLRLAGLVALVLLAAGTSQAQIGEKTRVADFMYGSPVAIGKDSAGFVQRAYRRGGRDIIATVVDGVIKRMVFRKFGGKAFNYNELKTIARREGVVASKNNRLPKEGQAWLVKGGKDVTRAVYDPEAKTFTITRDSYYKARDQRMQSPAPENKQPGH